MDAMSRNGRCRIVPPCSYRPWLISAGVLNLRPPVCAVLDETIDDGARAPTLLVVSDGMLSLAEVVIHALRGLWPSYNYNVS